jgi:N-acetylmuramoyl-L-alanine amidase
MKSALAIILLALGLVIPGRAATQGLERINVDGSEYIRLGEWAEANGFKVVTRAKSDAVELTNQSATLNFAVDPHNARKSQISGTTVMLCYPVINRRGTMLISLLDAQKSLEPILYPKKSLAQIHTICLDAGHGGKDPGNADGANFEKKYTLLLAQATEKLLQQAGFKVVLTRTNDVYISPAERPEIAARQGADLFVSLHYNSIAAAGVRGIQVHCLPPPGTKSSDAGGGRGDEPPSPGNLQDDRNILLAYEMLHNITPKLPLEDIGVKRNHFEVLRDAHMPAILIEGGFMTDPQDARKIYDPEFRQRMAQSIVNGILAYKEAIEEKPAEVKSATAAIKVQSGRQ